MTGVELYIRDNDNYYCYKQRHDGYLIDEFVNELVYEIFTMSAEEIIHSFHDKYFLENTLGNFHGAGKPLEYGIKVQKSEVKNPSFECVINDIHTHIWTNYNGETTDDDDQDYRCSYSDWMVYIDLIDRKIEGLDFEDEEDVDFTDLRDTFGKSVSDEEDEDGGPYGHGGCGYNGGYGNRSNNSFNDFLNGKFNNW